MSALELRVRAASDADVPAIARLHVRAWQVAYRGQIPRAVLAALDPKERAQMWQLTVQVPGHGLEVATIGEAVVGFCCLMRSRDAGAQEDVAEIAAIYVDPDRWRAGIGRALVGSSVERATRGGYEALTLWVLSSNARARKFYEQLGFAPDGESKLEDRRSYSLHELRYRRSLAPRVRGSS